jgi:hypothetical protein
VRSSLIVNNAFHEGDAPRAVSHLAIPNERPLMACAVKGNAFPVGESPTRRTLQPEATGAVMEVTKWLKPSV